MADIIDYAKANLEYWQKNKISLELLYRGKYVLIANQQVVKSHESAEKLENEAKGLEHYIIVACGFIPTPKDARVLGLPWKLQRRNP